MWSNWSCPRTSSSMAPSSSWWSSPPWTETLSSNSTVTVLVDLLLRYTNTSQTTSTSTWWRCVVSPNDSRWTELCWPHSWGSSPTNQQRSCRIPPSRSRRQTFSWCSPTSRKPPYLSSSTKWSPAYSWSRIVVSISSTSTPNWSGTAWRSTAIWMGSIYISLYI